MPALQWTFGMVYTCPKCGTQLPFKMRIMQTKGKCPHCGEPITPEELDERDLILNVTLAVVIAAIGGLVGYWVINSLVR